MEAKDEKKAKEGGNMKATEMYEGIIKALKARRKSLGLSQEKVAGIIGVHQYRVSLYERLAHIPNAGTIVEWANALGMEIIVKEG